MKGGLYIPPNDGRSVSGGIQILASMKGGLYIPPNRSL